MYNGMIPNRTGADWRLLKWQAALCMGNAQSVEIAWGMNRLPVQLHTQSERKAVLLHHVPSSQHHLWQEQPCCNLLP